MEGNIDSTKNRTKGSLQEIIVCVNETLPTKYIIYAVIAVPLCF